VHDPEDRVTPTVLYITNEQTINFGREAMNAYFEQNLGRPSKLEKVWVGEITQTFAELPTFVRDVYIWVDVLSPGRLFLSFKTDLSDASYVGTAIGRFFYTLEDIAAVYLYVAKLRAERLLGRQLEEIVLGRPVRFNENPEADALAQARLAEAALSAGYKRVYFEYEPIAAAYYYEMSMTKAQNVLVFDFGGGTLDITIMRLGSASERQVLATGGVPIAGDVFDRKIVRAKIPRLFGEGSFYRSLDKKLPLPGWIYDAFGDWRSLLTLQQPENMQTLRTITPSAERRREMEALMKLVTGNYSLKLFEVVEGVKRRLSARDDAIIALKGEGFVIAERITRPEFEQLIRPEYNIIERHLEETLQASGLRAGEIDVVIRTGGSSQIPLFQRMLVEKFGAGKVQSIDTFGSVTSGLGVIAHRIERGEISTKNYTQSAKRTPIGTDGRTNLPPINLDLVKQQILWQDGAAEDSASSPTGLAFLSKNYELTVVECPAHTRHVRKPLLLAEVGLPANTPVQSVVYATLEEPLLLATSTHRMILVTLRQLIYQQNAGLALAHLHGFDRGEQLCLVQHWQAVRDASQLILVSTQGYARRFEMAQIRPAIEGPTPIRLDWTLPGWPRLVIGAEPHEDLLLMTGSGRATRMPVESIRRTGTRAIQKQKADELAGGASLGLDDQLWVLSSEGYAKWLPAALVPAAPEGNMPGAVVIRRRGEICGASTAPWAPVWILTTTRLIPVAPAETPHDQAQSLAMHRALKLNKGEQVLGLL
jgi:hypothetical chaperone protein